ncbi:hypothetical protein EV426DRAFT_719874 [Tirmania nivea]|nr:hypothetical protein EV426DRAFT_719874 [Tirmania nivea]
MTKWVAAAWKSESANCDMITLRFILKESRTIQSLSGNYLLSLKTNPTCQQTRRMKVPNLTLWMMRRKRMEVTMSREITLLKKRLCNMLLLRLERKSCKKISIATVGVVPEFFFFSPEILL